MTSRDKTIRLLNQLIEKTKNMSQEEFDKLDAACEYSTVGDLNKGNHSVSCLPKEPLSAETEFLIKVNRLGDFK